MSSLVIVAVALRQAYLSRSPCGISLCKHKCKAILRSDHVWITVLGLRTIIGSLLYYYLFKKFHQSGKVLEATSSSH